MSCLAAAAAAKRERERERNKIDRVTGSEFEIKRKTDIKKSKRDADLFFCPVVVVVTFVVIIDGHFAHTIDFLKSL